MRFPGFEDEWVEKRLGEIATNKSRKYDPDKTKFIKCIELEHLASESGQLLGFIDGSQSGSIKNIFNKGDILFGKLRPYLKKYLQAPFDGVCSSEIWVLKGKGISNDFLYGIVQTNSFIDLANQSSGSKMPRADWNVVENANFSFPSLLEQEKITSFLTLIDKRITTQNKIIKQLESLIKVLREKLFRQQLRFKDNDGNYFAKWEELKLGKVAKIYDGTHQTPKYVESGVPFYSVENVTANNFTDTKLISEEVFEIENKRVKIEKGDILMTRIGDIGTTRYIDWEVNASFYVSLALIKQSDKCNSKYLAHYISTKTFQKELWNRTIHVAFPKKINLGEISECLITLPQISEQIKIANLLTDIDKKITTEKNIVNQYENQKKYLSKNIFI